MTTSAAYSRIQDKLARGEAVILDGAVATELQRHGARGFRLSDADHWGFEAVRFAPDAVSAVHRAYVEAGADIITTDTYGVLDVPEGGGGSAASWLDVSRRAIDLAREVAAPADRAVAFSIGGDVLSDAHLDTVRLLSRQFEESGPDLILFETLTMTTETRTREAIELLLACGRPVWLSFRRCREGACGIHGQLWGGREGDYFGRLARDMQDLGVGAILINCLPVEMVSGTIPWLRDYTDLPLGCYPNLGRFADPTWRFDPSVAPRDYADMALMWRAEGAQILGGCCGVGPAHIKATVGALAGSEQGAAGSASGDTPSAQLAGIRAGAQTSPWADSHGRDAWPVAFPDIVCDEGVYVPTEGSFLLWKHLFDSGLGTGARCLDAGCGSGLLAVQLARNGADSVAAIDIDKAAVTNTVSNAFRNDVSDKVMARVADLWELPELGRFDIVVASLLQVPTDPGPLRSGHQPADFWGRNLVDRLFALLPDLLAPDGAAYVIHNSLLSREQTETMLAQSGLTARILDFEFDRMPTLYRENLDQIRRVEASSDAYHFEFRDDAIMVTYLLEIAAQSR